MKDHVRKLIKTIIVTLICLAITGLIMISASTFLFASRQKELNELRASSLKETLLMLENEEYLTREDFYYNLEKNGKLMATLLKEQIENEEYKGQKEFTDGMIIKRVGDVIEQPEDEKLPHIDVKQLEEALKDPIQSSYSNGNSEETKVILSACEMGSGYYYVNWIEDYKFQNYMQTNIARDSFLSDLEKTFDGTLLVADAKGNLIYHNDSFAEYSTLDECGIDLNNPFSARLNGETYTCTYVKSEMFGSQAVLIVPVLTYASSILGWTKVYLNLSIIIVFTMIIWNYAVEKLVFNNVLSEEQEKKYHPKRVRRVIVTGAVIGAIVMLVGISFVQSMSNLYTQTQRGRNALDVLDKEIENRKIINQTKREKAQEWHIYYGKEIAEAISRNEKLLSRNKLAEISDVLYLNYLMAYDENGNEICASNNYVNFTLGKDKSDPTTDFRRLLRGIDSIAHDVVYDEDTGQTSKLIGVSIPFENRNGYGALILALHPSEAGPKDERVSYADKLRSLTLPGDLMMIVDKESGDILDCNDLDYTYYNISAFDIDVKESADSLMNYFMINGSRYYGLAKETEDRIYFDFLSESAMSRNSSGLSILAAILFLGVYALSMFMINRGYNEKVFAENVLIGAPVIRGSKIEIETADGRKKITTDPSRRFSFIPETFREMLPEDKAVLAFDVLVSIALLEIVYYVYIKKSASDSLLGFIMQGKWTRGLNLFAFASIVFIVAAVLLGMMVIKFIFYILVSTMDTKGETICRLIYNLLKYVALITILYYAFGYLGFNTSALLASVGFVTLAISMGSKDLVADVLAGITIVFEGEYQVGDMVEIGGYRGKVAEIGVRSTKLIGRGDNIKIINNRDVKDVLNMTRLNSWLPIEVTIPAGQPLEKIEEILDQNLQEIGKKIKEVIRGPYYYGVLSMNKEGITLSILTECKEEDYYRVQRRLNKELIKLFEQHKIPML